MLLYLLNLVFIVLVAIALVSLYLQARIYQEQKELINRESKALKMLRNKNLEALRSRFLRKTVNIKA